MELLKSSEIVAFFVGFWDRIKTLIWMLLSTFIQKTDIKTVDAHNEVVGYLVMNFQKRKSYDKVFGSQYESYRNGKYGLVFRNTNPELNGSKLYSFDDDYATWTIDDYSFDNYELILN